MLKNKISPNKTLDMFPDARRQDLNEFFAPDADNTILLTINGTSGEDVNISSQDLIFVDRSKTLKTNDIVLKCVDG